MRLLHYFAGVLLFLTTCLWAPAVQAQVTFTVDHFSTTYYGKVTVEDTSEVFSKGSIAIYERNNPQPVIEVSSDELAVNLHDGAVDANIKELPYGEQSVIIFEDFNFDGKKDFAIESGQNSCYHGPSFNVYLAGINGFEISEAFTDLAQNYCGMFDVDTTLNTLHTMTKDGCCWHQFSEFVVENNEPKPVHIIEEDATQMPFIKVSEEKRVEGRMVKETNILFSANDVELDTVLAFRVAGKNKQVLLYRLGTTLNYVSLSGEDQVELAYPPIGKEDAAARFRYDRNANTLSFRNEDAVYTITDNGGKTFVQIRWKGKDSVWNAESKGRKGSLKKLAGSHPDNVKTQ